MYEIVLRASRAETTVVHLGSLDIYKLCDQACKLDMKKLRIYGLCDERSY
jgi:hypothetical protein